MNPIRTCLFSLVLLAFPFCVSAQEKDYTKPIVDKAVKALGKKQKQSLAGLTFQSKSNLKINDETTLEITTSWSVQGVDQYRADLSVLTPQGQTISVIAAIDGKKGWMQNQQNNKKEDIPAGVAPMLRADIYAIRLAQRPTFLRQKGFKLSPLGEMRIDGADAVGIKAAKKGMPEVDIYFSKKTGLPVRSSVRVKEQGGNEVEHAFTYGDYKEFDGVKHFTRIVLRRDNSVAMDMRLSGIQLQERVDKAVFRQP